MPQVAQQDYIYLEVSQTNASSMFDDKIKRQVANAIDRGVGLDIIFHLRREDVDILCKTLAAGTDADGYYIAYWDWDNDNYAFNSFEKPAPESVEENE